MKVIFLDIDGVLNTSQTFKEINEEYKKTGIDRIEIDEFRLEFLKEIIDKTGAIIVLNSSWKNNCKMENGKFIVINQKIKELINIFNKFNLSIYDITLDIRKSRQEAIYMWLKDKDVESFIIIDDDPYHLDDFVGKELIKTSTTKDGEMIMNMDDAFGLSEFHIEEAVAKLNNIKVKKRIRW